MSNGGACQGRDRRTRADRRPFSGSSREEQHDDQILHELLRCIKALSSTVVRADQAVSTFK